MQLGKLALLALSAAVPALATNVIDTTAPAGQICDMSTDFTTSKLAFRTKCRDTDVKIDYNVVLEINKAFGVKTTFKNKFEDIKTTVDMDLIRISEFNGSIPLAFTPRNFNFNGNNWTPMTVDTLTSSGGVNYYNFASQFTHSQGWKLDVYGMYDEGRPVTTGQKLLTSSMKYNLNVTNFPFQYRDPSLALTFKLKSNEAIAFDGPNEVIIFGDNSLGYGWVDHMLSDGVAVPITAQYSAADNTLTFSVKASGSVIHWDPIFFTGGGGGNPPPSYEDTTTTTTTTTITRSTTTTTTAAATTTRISGP